MAWYDTALDALGSFGRGVIAAAPAAFNYLAAREQTQAVRDVAKLSSGASGGSQVAQRIRQSGTPLSFGPTTQQNGGSNILAQLGIPGLGGGQVAQQAGVVFDASTAVAPYIADKIGSYLFGGGGINGKGPVALTMPGQYGQQCQGGGTALIQAPQAFTEAAPGLRARSTFIVQNPMTGNLSWYRNMGKPVLFSGDLAATKRVARVRSRLGPGRRSYHRKR